MPTWAAFHPHCVPLSSLTRSPPQLISSHISPQAATGVCFQVNNKHGDGESDDCRQAPTDRACWRWQPGATEWDAAPPCDTAHAAWAHYQAGAVKASALPQQHGVAFLHEQ